ncbi:MAG: preprotein translocase subunit SecA [Betaproteobacteria bacterium]|nr:preprotein translocase subunit SecA [Betaproteobacteria bacterium]
MVAASSTLIGAVYPERDARREGKLERFVTAVRYFTGGVRIGEKRLDRIVAATGRAAIDLPELSAEELLARATHLRARLKREGFNDLGLAASAFALVREAAGRTIGMRHFDVQLIGGWAMLNGMLAEMETGEGKTLTATLTAATAALAGRAVHVVTVNDYLAERDAQWMRPVYEALGISVGCVKQGMDPDSRRHAYGCDITYCSNKEVAFDYLRDRRVLGGKPRAIAMKMDTLGGAGVAPRLLLRGLQFVIVDEADSVLVDEARTPLILSTEARHGLEEAVYADALDLARQLGAGDYGIRDKGIEITAQGLERLEVLGEARNGIWRGPRRREQLVRQALSALHLFQRDKHYLVREGKVVIIDENTGRVMPDRSWEHGLHQLVEIKEGCEATGRRETLARISYQRFFRRYLYLAGMTGTAREVASELWAVYRLRVATIPTNKPGCRVRQADYVYGRSDLKWQAAVARIAELHAAGCPVLVGTRSVAASETLAGHLEAAQLPFRLLNARQDRDEAEIVARAGESGCITVATNMAGRGTDIKLGAGVIDRGGLHVIATELNDSARIDRQLFGRCARQGDPGSCQAILAIEEDLIGSFFPLAATHLRHLGRLPLWLGRLVFRVAQWRAERSYSRARRDLLDLDDYLGDMLAFSGRGE